MAIEQPTCERSTSCNSTAKSGVQPCPACGGALMPLRGVWRCSRCYFSLCVGCEPEMVPAPAKED